MVADSTLPRIAFDGWVRRGSAPAREVARLSDQLLQMGHEGCILGGVVRDACLLGPEAVPRDVDVAIDAPDLDRLHAIVGDCGYEVVRETALGGLKVRREGVQLDLWLLHNTWAHNLVGNHSPTFADLASSTPLDMEAVAMQLQPGGAAIDRGLAAAARRRSVELQCSTGWSNSGLAWRAVRLANRIGFGLGPHADELAVQEIPAEVLEELGLLRTGS